MPCIEIHGLSHYTINARPCLSSGQKSLPQLKESVQVKLDKTRFDLNQLGPGLPETDDKRIVRLMQVGGHHIIARAEHSRHITDTRMCFSEVSYLQVL